MDYLLHVRDLLGPGHAGIRILDIGTGASLIYPVLGRSAFGWRFVGTDIDTEALASAASIMERNPRLKSGIIRKTESFHAVICNPPFHESEEQVRAATLRKWKNLGREHAVQAMRNFSGRPHELWCDGGEFSFIRRLIRESVRFGGQVGWFTTLVAKAAHLPTLSGEAQVAGASEIRIVEMAQGQKKSRLLAWRFV